MEQIELADEAATEALGARLAATLRGGDLLALDGDLGSGKTTLVRGLARGLGIDPLTLASPSFITMQEYTKGRITLTHIDAWRIKPSDIVATLESLGWDELLGCATRVVVVEWAAKLAAHLPPQRLSITLQYSSDGSRRSVSLSDSRRQP